MSDQSAKDAAPADIFAAMMQSPQQLFSQFLPGGGASMTAPGIDATGDSGLAQWTNAAQRMHSTWLEFQRSQPAGAGANRPAMLTEPGGFAAILQGWIKALPLAQPDTQK